MKIALVVGHRNSSQGASNRNQNITEFQYNRKLAKEIKKYCNHNCVIVYRDDDSQGYANLPNKINEVNPDIILSLHCNAFNEHAGGHEVLYWNTSSKGKRLALQLNSAIHKALGTNDRGVKPKYKGDRGALVLRHTKAPCVILEPFFIDNDLDYLNATRNNLGKVLAETLNKM